MRDSLTDIRIDPDLVRRLVAAQFPDWAGLPVTPVDPQGWDNRSFRLGDGIVVRLPSAERYVAQVEKEHRWLPVLASHLPVPIPKPLAQGAPGEGYPYPSKHAAATSPASRLPSSVTLVKKPGFTCTCPLRSTCSRRAPGRPLVLPPA